VVERGDHETLLDAEGRYASLWNVQAGRVEFSTAETD
jgi:ABC-type multidrug transport system fused ATPase/permease subunit